MLRLDDVAGSGGARADALARASDVRDQLYRHGALLIPGAGVTRAADLAQARRAFGSRPAPSREPFAAWDRFGDDVYSWPKWGAHCLAHHNGRAPTALLRVAALAAARRRKEAPMRCCREAWQQVPDG